MRFPKKTVIAVACLAIGIPAVSSASQDPDVVAAKQDLHKAVHGEKPSTPASTPASKPEKTPTPEPKPEMTRSQKEALEQAESYLDGQAFSKKGLVSQLKFEGYDKDDAKFAVDHVDADWKAEAVEAAESYLDGQSFSRDGLLQQLKFEKYTVVQAEYAVGKVY